MDLRPLDAPRLKTPRKDPAVAQGSVGRAASLRLGGLALPRPWACPLQVHEALTPWCHPSVHTRRSCLPACVRSDPWGSLSDHPLLARCPLPRLDYEEPLLHPGASVACISSWNVLHCPGDAGTAEWSDPAGPPRPHRVWPCSPTPRDASAVPGTCPANSHRQNPHEALHSPSLKNRWPRSPFLVGQHTSWPRDEMVRTQP